MNIMGEKIYTETLNDSRTTLNKKLSSGIYFVKVTSADKKWVRKMVVQ
jgi:hypothetical protein